MTKAEKTLKEFQKQFDRQEGNLYEVEENLGNLSSDIDELIDTDETLPKKIINKLHKLQDEVDKMRDAVEGARCSLEY